MAIALEKTGMAPELEVLREEILTDAFGEDEQMWAFQQAFSDHLTTPAPGSVLGTPVEVSLIEYDGNTRVGLRARCTLNGKERRVALSDIQFPEQEPGARLVAVYRKWLGLEPLRET